LVPGASWGNVGEVGEGVGRDIPDRGARAEVAKGGGRRMKKGWVSPLPVDGNAARPLTLVPPAPDNGGDRTAVNPREMAYAEERRFRSLVCESVTKAIARLIREEVFKKHKGSQWRDFKDKLERYFQDILLKNADKVIQAAKVKPSATAALQKVAETKKEARRQMAAELKDSRNKLRHMKKNIDDMLAAAKQEAERQVAEEHKQVKVTLAGLKNEIREAAKELAHLQYRNLERFQTEFSIVIPAPVDARISAPDAETKLPNTPGIYFIWDPTTELWAYIGKSVSLSSRCKLGNHHVLSEHHMVAFLEVDHDELDYAEIVYMALLRPYLNFGGRLYSKGKKPWAATTPIEERI
jgi:hypothetical protein